MPRLIIGYGNPSRRDDGVALLVVNRLRHQLGLPSLDEMADGYEDLGRPLDTLFLQQLTPELAETLAAYEHVIFVDARVGNAGAEPIRRVRIDPNADPALVSHHFRPGRLLALARSLYGAAPEAELISILGFDFDFGPELSEETAAAALRVVEELWREYGSGHEAAAPLLPNLGEGDRG